jgi:hypothetical protein
LLGNPINMCSNIMPASWGVIWGCMRAHCPLPTC